ncbi:hypothetical protein NDU88_000496 [Pleurodeles waltl]|uniref:Sterol O-acyltransferase 2 n=1 Tax=Pleurodeles waltl TaxID=8319 RepID=A0AAV7S8R8_PLEWA|nr:hypothetical protein NDU88_000496 [Pleurodeles waltl]
MDSNEKRANGARNRKKQKGAAQRASGLTPNGNLEHVDSVTGVIHWKRHMEVVKAELLENIQGQMSEVLDTAMQEAVQSYTQRLKGHDAPMPGQQSRNQEVEKQKVFIERQSLLDELMEVEHFRTIYHMFVATLCVFILSTMAVDFIDEGRLIMDFDILFYTFGKFPTVVVSWLCMFLYTLLVPYKALQLWGGSVHTARLPWLLSTTMGLLLITCQTCVLGIYPIYVVIHHKLPPASSFIIVLEQIRFLMKSHSFVREAVPVVLRTKLAEGKKVKLPEFSSYLYFLFCPTLIYRDSYPRTPYIRWKYVAKNLGQVERGSFNLGGALEPALDITLLALCTGGATFGATIGRGWQPAAAFPGIEEAGPGREVRPFGAQVFPLPRRVLEFPQLPQSGRERGRWLAPAVEAWWSGQLRLDGTSCRVFARRPPGRSGARTERPSACESRACLQERWAHWPEPRPGVLTPPGCGWVRRLGAPQEAGVECWGTAWADLGGWPGWLTPSLACLKDDV